MSHTKNINTKNHKAKASAGETKPAESEELEVTEELILKPKKVPELDIVEEPVAILVEEKTDDDAATTEDAEESAENELSLDEEELNPFGDKWEQ